MDIKEFFANYKNHPILFIGSGFSLRYLENSYNWPNLIKKIAIDLFENHEPYHDLVAECTNEQECNLPLLAEKLEEIFNKKQLPIEMASSKKSMIFSIIMRNRELI